MFLCQHCQDNPCWYCGRSCAAPTLEGWAPLMRMSMCVRAGWARGSTTAVSAVSALAAQRARTSRWPQPAITSHSPSPRRSAGCTRLRPAAITQTWKRDGQALQTCQRHGRVQGHAEDYRHAKIECNSLNIVRDIASFHKSSQSHEALDEGQGHWTGNGHYRPLVWLISSRQNRWALLEYM